MRRLLGMSLSDFIGRISTEPLLVIKRCFIFWWLQLSSFLSKRRLDLYDPYETKDLTKINAIVPQIEEQLDNPELHLDDKTADTVFVFGENSQTDFLVAKITRRKDHNQFWLLLRLSDGRCYVQPYPDKAYPSSQEFSAGGLRIKTRTPFRNFRVSFNGLLRESSTGRESDGTLVHVKFSFTCCTSSWPVDLSTDIHPTLQADYLAKEGLNIQIPRDHLDSVLQTANFFGTVSVDGSDSIEVTLWGARKRSRERFPKHGNTQISEFFGYSKEGQLIYAGECAFPSSKSKLPFCHYVERTSISWPTLTCQLSFGGQKATFNGMKISLENERRSALVTVDAPQSSTHWRGAGFKTDVHVTTFRFQDGDEGCGVFLENTWSSDSRNILQMPGWKIEAYPAQEDAVSLILPLDKLSCQDSSLTGGKGSSLAILTSLSKKQKAGFDVPTGLVVTTAAYAQFFSQTGVRIAVEELERNAWSYTADRIKGTCEQLVEQVSKTKLPSNIQKAVEKQISSQFPGGLANKRFAVRSSASGEDSEEMSAAGQMSTLLGVEGLEKIFDAIVKCWASQFSFTAIQYKRQNGQRLNSPMGVVVQEMVDAEVAGVLFTCDPVTGNPFNVTLTSNYGLGESVVSASAEPDTMVYHRKENNQTELTSVLLGRKSTKVVMGDQGDVVEQHVDENDSKSCSLSEDRGLQLSSTGLKIEEAYGLPVDIEWAFKQDKLYMLQARPITTFDQETKHEISHAVNSHLRAEDEYNTKANVGEVFPAATSHLGITFIDFFFSTCVQNLYGHRNKYAFLYNPYCRFLAYFRNHVYINVPNFMFRFYKKGEQSFLAESNQISGWGRTVDDPPMFDQADRRNHMYPTTFAPLQICLILRDFITANRYLEESTRINWNKSVDLIGCKTSEDIFNKVFLSALTYIKGANAHVVTTFNSSLANTIALGVLATDNNGWGPKVYADFALILSCCGNLESADIPRSLKLLAAEIRKSVDAEKFTKMTLEEAQAWLESTNSSAGKAYKEFILKHGHRCIREFDVYSKPWRVNRLPLIKNIQDCVMQKEAAEDKKFVSVDEVMKRLSVPLSWKNKLLMRFVIPMCRNGVFNREKSKALIVKMVDHLRQGFWTLSEQMVKEGRLPDKDLIFFLSHFEIHQLIKTRNPIIVQRAIRRRQVFPELGNMEFPEITKGLPKSIAEERKDQVEEEYVSDLEMTGTPVSQGTVKAFVRVATNIQEAAHIKAGEILIAYSTDVAWSPYFPLLSGVATELGGLVSHGAVVAREYGLPCVIAVRDATKKFKTGDYILLDGNKGILKRLEPSKEQ